MICENSKSRNSKLKSQGKTWSQREARKSENCTAQPDRKKDIARIFLRVSKQAAVHVETRPFKPNSSLQ